MKILEQIRRLIDPKSLLDTGYQFEQLGDGKNPKNADKVKSRFMRGNVRGQSTPTLSKEVQNDRTEKALKLKW